MKIMFETLLLSGQLLSSHSIHPLNHSLPCVGIVDDLQILVNTAGSQLLKESYPEQIGKGSAYGSNSGHLESQIEATFDPLV